MLEGGTRREDMPSSRDYHDDASLDYSGAPPDHERKTPRIE